MSLMPLIDEVIGHFERLQLLLAALDLVLQARERRGILLAGLDVLGDPAALVSLRGKVLMKSLRGMPASRTAMIMISFSIWRISPMCARSCAVSASNMRGESFSSMNSSASFLRAFCVRGSSAPCLASAASTVLQVLADQRHAPRDFLRIGAGVDDAFFVLVVVAFLLVVLVAFGDEFDLGRVLRLRDHVGRVRIDEADHQVDHARLAGLELLVGVQQVLVRGRIAGEREPHRIETFLDALGDADFALARQQFDRAHLAHVHAHRIGRAAEFGVERGECGGGFFDRLFVGRR